MRKFVMLAVALAALSARAEQKNVQLLTNMSDLQLQRTMNMMRSSLGVHCDFCHVVDDKGNWQFEKDDKKEKKTAREMIAMVLRLNKEQFGGKVEVSCWTCHRGTTHPASVVTLPQAAPPFPTVKPAPQHMPPLADVIKKYASSLGNLTRLQKPRILIGTRESVDGRKAYIQVEESAGRVHITLETPNGKAEQVLNEKGGWSKDAQGVYEFPPSGLENFREIARSLELPMPSSIPADARVTGIEPIENHIAVVVAYNTDAKTQVKLYFDNTTGALNRRVVLKTTPIGVIPQQTDFEEWRDLGDARFPYKIKTSLVDPWVGSSRHYTEVRLDADIDESVFAKPK
jgi:photosynthetic reaction center cytochrome c subunit